jgi:hypothetical protein
MSSRRCCETSQREAMEDTGFKLCPFCKEQIRQEAIKCRFCGEWLESSEPDSARKVTTDKPGLTSATPPPPQQRPTRTRAKKSLWRGILGVFLIVGVSNALRSLANDPMRHDRTYVISYLVFNVLLVAIGVWLVVSFLRSAFR